MLGCLAAPPPPPPPRATPSRPPGTNDVVIFRPTPAATGREPTWLDDNVFIKRIVAVAGAPRGVRGSWGGDVQRVYNTAHAHILAHPQPHLNA